MKLIRLLGAAAVIAATAGTLAPAAQAAENSYPGANDYIHFFDDNTFRDGTYGHLSSYALSSSPKDPDLRDNYWQGDHSKAFNDHASSVVNKTSYYYVLFFNRNYDGVVGTPERPICIRPHSHITDLDGQNFGDVMSSFKRGSGDTSHCVDITGSPVARYGTPNG